METWVKKEQQNYYSALQSSDPDNVSPFVIFMLRMIRNAVDEFVSGPDDAAPLSNNEKRLLEMVSKDPGVTAAEIAEAIGVSERTVKKYISSLSNRGYIKREGGDKTGRWIIVHN